MEYCFAAERTEAPFFVARIAARSLFSRSVAISEDAQLKGDENGLIHLSIGAVVAIISMVEVVGDEEDGLTLLVAQV